MLQDNSIQDSVNIALIKTEIHEFTKLSKTTIQKQKHDKTDIQKTCKSKNKVPKGLTDQKIKLG